MEVRTLASRAERVGLAYGSVFICDQGIPFRDKTLTAIRTASGFLTAGQFEEFVGLAARSCTARKGGPEAIRVPEFARDVMAWRDRAIRSLVESTKDKDRPYHNHQVIHTFLPTLASLRDALAEAFGKSIGRLAKPRGIQAALREHPEWDIEDVWNFTAEQSRANRNSGAWHRTLCYLWEIESIIESKLERLRETEGITDFVREVLGERYGVHPQQIKLAMQSGVRTIGPVEMARLLLLSPSLRQFAQSVPQGQRAMKKRKHGPDKLPSEETTWFMLGHSVEEGLASGLGLVEARKAVVGRYEYDTIVRYHRMYRKHLKREF
jgi:hypothetical protein